MMFQYVLVILEKGAVPFCHYQNPHFYSTREPERMSLAILENVVEIARTNELFVNFLYGKQRLPPEYEKLIETVKHVKIMPLPLTTVYRDGIAVLDADDCDSLVEQDNVTYGNLILRVEKHNIADLSRLFRLLQGKCMRINIHLVGIEYFTESEIAIYEGELETISRELVKQYEGGKDIEVSLLSDRMLLSAMNNCDAGVKHITVAPDGKCYICPGFYYRDTTSDISVSLQEALAAPITNGRLLDIACAPICSRCDAYHCKRCVYLNLKSTGEINTPSGQQCIVAHIEREMSRIMANSLEWLEGFQELPRIACTPFRDPLQKVLRRNQSAPMATSGGRITARPESDGFLAKVFDTQQKILQLLQKNKEEKHG